MTEPQEPSAMKKPTRGLGQFDELFLEKPDATEEKSEQSFQERAIGNVVNPLEQIDSVFRRTGNRLWLGVAGIALLVAALVAWGFVAQRVVNEKVAVVILPESGLYPVATLQTGVVGDVLVSEDQVVSVGDVLTTLQIPNVGELDVTSPIDGTVVAVDTARGRIAGPGNTLFLLAPKGEPTQLIGFVGPSGLSQMQLRQKVTVVIPTVNPQRYGRMKGSVSYIGSTPTTRSRISSILGGDAQAVSVLQSGPVYEIRVTPETSPTPSGFSWTVGDGPPVRPPLATNGLAFVEISRQSLASKAFGS